MKGLITGILKISPVLSIYSAMNIKLLLLESKLWISLCFAIIYAYNNCPNLFITYTPLEYLFYSI